MSKRPYDGYGWIKVPRYTMDESKTWEERYHDLDKHHIQETTFLIDKIRELAAEIEGLQNQRPA